MMMNQTQSKLAKLLPVLLILLLASACGDGSIGTGTLGSIGTNGDSGGGVGTGGGEIFYSFPATGATGEGGSGDDGDYDNGSTFDSNSQYDSGAFNGGYGGGSGGGYDGDPNSDGYYDSSADDGFEMPPTIAKCERSGRDDFDLDPSKTKSSTRSVFALIMKANSPTMNDDNGDNEKESQKKMNRNLTLRGSPGTYKNSSNDLSLYVLNLASGDSLMAEINRDGSFDPVTIKTQDDADPIWVSAFDGEKLVKSIVFVPRAYNQEEETDDFPVCLEASDEEAEAILNSAHGFDFNRIMGSKD